MDAVEQEEADKKKKEDLLPKLKPKWNEFLDHLFSLEINFNGTEAYLKTYSNCTRESARRLASQLLTNVDIQKNIATRFAERKVSVDEAIDMLSQQARAKLSFFYKESTRWTFEPLPTQEIIDEREVVDEREKEKKRKKRKGEEDEEEDDEPKMRTQYQVKCLVIDMSKVLDPQYSHLVKRITDSPRNGITIELYDGQAANDLVLKALGGYKNTLALTDNTGGPLIPPRDEKSDAEYNRTLSKLADAIGEILSGSSTETASQLDTAK